MTTASRLVDGIVESYVLLMKSTLKRLAVILLVFLILIELIERASVTRPESWNERSTILTLLPAFGALVWGVMPLFSRLGTSLRGFLRAGLVAVLAMGIIVIWNLHCGYLRPNLGWYEEPHWVAKFPEFQKQQRARIQARLW